MHGDIGQSLFQYQIDSEAQRRVQTLRIRELIGGGLN